MHTKSNTCTFGQVENAMIIWEWMVENRNEELSGPFRRRFEYEGTADMRILATSLAVWLEDVWTLLPDDLRDGFSFDWEIVPAILQRLDWENLRLPDPKDAIDALSETFAT